MPQKHGFVGSTPIFSTMIFQTKNIAIDINAFDAVKTFIKTNIDQVRKGDIPYDDFIDAMEDVLTDSFSPLSWEGAVVMKAINKGNNGKEEKLDGSEKLVPVQEHTDRCGDGEVSHESISCCRTRSV